MEKKSTAAPAKQHKKDSNLISWIAPIGCLIAGYLVYRFVLGDPSGFDPAAEANKDNSFFFPHREGPLNPWSRMYEGGFVVPILIGFVFMVIAFSIERFFTIVAAKGKGNNTNFVRKIQLMLADKDIDGAIKECDRQKGAVGNVMKAGLERYKKLIDDTNYTTDQKLAMIQKEVEEATALEMPMLQKNLVFLSTLTSLSVLVALLGTVLGMIRSFSALADAGGSQGAAQLAIGISEALYNTATGIFAGALAMVMYNIFTTKIDNIVHAIDESGFTLTQSFASLYK